MRKSLLSLAVASLAAALFWSACGLIPGHQTPKEPALSISGSVTDEQGRPLDGVLLTEQLNHHLPAAVAGTAAPNEHHLLRVDRVFSLKEHGHDLHLTFSREGFHDLDCSLDAASPNLVKTSYGIWPNESHLPLAMIPRKRVTPAMENSRFGIDCSSYPQIGAISLHNLATRDPSKLASTLIPADVTAPGSLPAGSLYITLTHAKPKPNDDKSDFDPLEVNLPENLTLHITGDASGGGATNGFIRIVPRLGYPPLQITDTAPEGPYAPSITFDKKRLKQLRDADAVTVPDVAEYFFFRAGDYYGKGTFSWAHRLHKTDTQPEPAVFQFELWIQKTPNDRNVCTHS